MYVETITENEFEDDVMSEDEEHERMLRWQNRNNNATKIVNSLNNNNYQGISMMSPPNRFYGPSSPRPSENARCFRRMSTQVEAMVGASTVAIDNKIEQAMDLVKSHLMFAVKE
ncbi:unnamed protein product, partial [Owenia fusiformis]